MGALGTEDGTLERDGDATSVRFERQLRPPREQLAAGVKGGARQ